MGQGKSAESDSKTSGASLYDRLGGIYGIAAVVNHFSDNVLRNKKVGRQSQNPRLREWSRKQSAARLAGLKWLRTLWVAEKTGGPYKFVSSSSERKGMCPLSLENAHKQLKISSDEFDEVARELKKSLDHFHVPQSEQEAVLGAFAAHKVDITQASGVKCPRPE
jgi:hemoglobin